MATVKPKLITLAASEFGAAELTIAQLCYDEQNDRLLFISVLNGVRHLVSYSAQSGIVWYVPVSGDLPHQARFTDGKIRLVSGTNVITRSADDGSLISSQSGFTGTSGIVRFDGRTGALYTPTSGSGIEQWLPGRSSDDSALLGDVVTSLCERVGLTTADLDVTELTDEVHGFGIARQISARGALEMLAAAYTFDAVESDHQLKFKKRGRSPSRVIPDQDLVPVNTEREAFIETRAQEIELPLRFTVVYQGLQRSVREWAMRQGWGGRPVRQEQAQGILVAALGMLAAHFGYGEVRRAS
jgi:Putative phage tail protein